MPRDGSSLPIYQVHIADGFSNDCDEIVNRCLQLKPLDFKEFAKLWKEMNFDLLYEGRMSSAEIAELSEELIHIAKHYMVKDTSYYEESVTGLFLVYSLLNLQPFQGFASLRLVPSDVRAVNRIETVARRERRLDVLYVLGEVLTKWTQYHADERPRGMEGVLRKYLEGYTSIDSLGVRPVGVFYRQNEELDNIRDSGTMTRQYMHAKAALFSDSREDSSLQYINERLANQLNSSLRKLVMGVIEDGCDYDQENVSEEEEDDDKEERKMSEDRLTTVQAIKAKAMSNAVDPMNHLTSAENRKKSKTAPASSRDLKKPTGKIKSGSRTRPITTSPKKIKTEAKPRRKPNPIIDFSDNSDDDADDPDLLLEFNQVPDDTDDDDNEDGNNENRNTDDDDNDNENSQEIKKQENDERQYEESIGFNVESLPLILRTGDFGPDIEIEIIDHTKPKRKKIESSKTTSPVVITPRPRTPRTTKKTKTPKTPNSDEDEQLSIKSRINFLKTYKKGRKDDFAMSKDGLPLRIIGKRDQKRRDIKSRFQKQGLLPIANFDEDQVEKS
ncbi:snRNA-activating protein complex subunit 1-like [Maniola hyperantus]|uniref:snRNA-activating protein complex subunit 1-like n=1 Tax=Aphantopus hyperantus TaxID=2795564 RepID=UPI00156A5099|nr:snRNA-activating protein complex subunit 1-like [Maniola hyperantus]